MGQPGPAAVMQSVFKCGLRIETQLVCVCKWNLGSHYKNVFMLLLLWYTTITIYLHGEVDKYTIPV